MWTVTPSLQEQGAAAEAAEPETRNGDCRKSYFLSPNPSVAVSSLGGAGLDVIRYVASPIRSQGGALPVPGRCKHGPAEAAGRPAAQPAASGAPVGVAAYPACGAAHRLRTTAGPAARPGRGPSPARSRGWARGFSGPLRSPLQRHLHSGGTPRPPGAPRATTRWPAGPGRKPLNLGWAGPRSSAFPSGLDPGLGSPALRKASNPDSFWPVEVHLSENPGQTDVLCAAL